MITNEAQGVLVLWSINLYKCQWLGEIGALTFPDRKGESSLEIKSGEEEEWGNGKEFHLIPDLQNLVGGFEVGN